MWCNKDGRASWAGMTDGQSSGNTTLFLSAALISIPGTDAQRDPTHGYRICLWHRACLRAYPQYEQQCTYRHSEV